MRYHACTTASATLTILLLLLGQCFSLNSGNLEHDIIGERSNDGSSLDHTIGKSPHVVVEWHLAEVTLQQSVVKPHISRHELEKRRLLSTLEKSRGKWNSNHPRHRLLDALHGFSKYYERQRAETDRLRSLYKHVSKSQKKLLESHLSYSEKFRHVEHRLASNQHLCDDVVDDAIEFYGLDRKEVEKHISKTEAQGRHADKISVSQSLKHIVRDWSTEGEHERNATFACLFRTLDHLYPSRLENDDDVRVLLPGAGLGRLGYDVNRLGGFDVTINEWSMYMNVMYRFLERQRTKLSQSVHPFVDGWSHHATNENMYRAVSFPDAAVDANQVLMVEGDFTSVFNEHTEHYDVVLTYFFIDTARNLMSYFDTIKRVLKPGGKWINLGPLLYGTSPFVQLPLEDVITVTEAMGFKFLETDDVCGSLTFPDQLVRNLEAVYSFDHLALTKNAYKAQFWVAEKL